MAQKKEFKENAEWIKKVQTDNKNMQEQQGSYISVE